MNQSYELKKYWESTDLKLFDAWDICITLKMGLTSCLQLKHRKPLIRWNCKSASNATHTLHITVAFKCMTYNRHLRINSTVSTRNHVTGQRTAL